MAGLINYGQMMAESLDGLGNKLLKRYEIQRQQQLDALNRELTLQRIDEGRYQQQKRAKLQQFEDYLGTLPSTVETTNTAEGPMPDTGAAGVPVVSERPMTPPELAARAAQEAMGRVDINSAMNYMTHAATLQKREWEMQKMQSEILRNAVNEAKWLSRRNPEAAKRIMMLNPYVQQLMKQSGVSEADIDLSPEGVSVQTVNGVTLFHDGTAWKPLKQDTGGQSDMTRYIEYQKQAKEASGGTWTAKDAVSAADHYKKLDRPVGQGSVSKPTMADATGYVGMKTKMLARRLALELTPEESQQIQGSDPNAILALMLAGKIGKNMSKERKEYYQQAYDEIESFGDEIAGEVFGRKGYSVGELPKTRKAQPQRPQVSGIDSFRMAVPGPQNKAKGQTYTDAEIAAEIKRRAALR